MILAIVIQFYFHNRIKSLSWQGCSNHTAVTFVSAVKFQGFKIMSFVIILYLYSWWILQGASNTLIILEAVKKRAYSIAFPHSFSWDEKRQFLIMNAIYGGDLIFFLSLWNTFSRTIPMKSVCRPHDSCTFLKLFLLLLIIHCNSDSTVLSLSLLQRL